MIKLNNKELQSFLIKEGGELPVVNGNNKEMK